MLKRREIIRILVMVALAIVPLVFVPIGEGDYFYLPKVYALRLIAIAYLFVIYKYRNKLKDVISSDWINRLLFLYIAWLVFSTIFSINILNSIVGLPSRVEGLSTILLYFALFLIARQQGTISKKNISYMLTTGCVIVFYGILQSYGLEFFPRDIIREDWVTPFATIGNPNFLGTYIVLLLPFAVHSYIIEKKMIGLFKYAILFYGLLSTMTRGTWIGAFFSILLYICIVFCYQKSFKIKFRDIVFIGIVTVSCLFIFDMSNSGSFLFRLLSISQDIGEVITGGDNLQYAGSYRMFIWLRVIELIKIRPIFGFGLENLHLAFNQYFGDNIISKFGRIMFVDKAHNEYLHIAVTSGIPALLIYLSFISLIIQKGISKLLDFPYAIPLFVAVIGYLVQAFFNISVVSVAYIFWIFLGFLASSKLIEPDSN